MPELPVLWHIEISHYNEKARWALDHKAVAHERRAPPPGAHMAVALWLTRGAVKTFPMLELDGERIGDSTRIIEALERRFPDPPLYPADPGERARALSLEEFFDEEVAPHVRLLGQYEATRDQEVFSRFVEATGPLRGRAARLGRAPVATMLKVRYGTNRPGAADLARRKVAEGIDRLEAELDGRDHLVGGTFTVADLTAAAILYPFVRPPNGPHLPPHPEPLQRYIDSFSGRPALEWISKTYARHRGQSAATRTTGAAAHTARP